ncbi:MAG: hypothetical protein QOJ92_1380 [Frankiales bacterium]|nr:hypothetical protein [Frankiales bacterium]
MRRTPLLIAVVSLAGALAASATAAGKTSATPTFRQYTSPVGAAGHQGDLPPAATDPAPFGIYQQDGIGDNCGEPSLGVSPGGAVLYACGLQALRVSFDGKGSGSSTWTDVTPKVEGEQSSDPIIWQDPSTGRVFMNQLMPQGCSLMAYTDNFAETWTQTPLGCGAGIAFDHQTVGTGTPRLLKTAPTYPNIVYYCTNDVAAADCSTSLDGGLTFSPAHPVFGPESACAPITGHVKSAPDGTVYLMPDGCGAHQSVWVSENDATTWTERPIPGSTVGDAGHPVVATGHDGTVYAAWGSNDNVRGGRIHVSVSRDKGVHWTAPVPLGKEKGIKVSRFPIGVAGDGDRAVIGFLGSTSGGDPGNKNLFKGRWDLYLSYTYDRGKHWVTYNATPGSPVQVGSVCTGGLGCDGDRNLLDFNEMVIGPDGRVIVAFADGCLKTKGCTTKDRLRKGAIVKQLGGTPLLRVVK